MEPILSSLIAGLFGAVAAAIPVWAIARRQPSRHVQDSVAIVGVSGELVAHLSDEIERLSREAREAKKSAELAWDRVSELSRQAATLQVRVMRLEEQVKDLGGDPEAA